MAVEHTNRTARTTSTLSNIFKRGFYAVVLLACAWSGASVAAQNLPFALGAPFVAQQPLVLDSAERSWLDERRVLRAGIAIADYEPIDITSDRNRYQGISADYLSLVSSRLAIPVQVQGFAKREQAIAALRAGEIDLLTSANGFEQGVDGLAFTQQYLPDKSVVVARGSHAGLSTSLAGKRVALLDGYADDSVVHRAYPDSEIVLAPSLHSAMEALSMGDIDAFIGNDIIIRAYCALRPYLGFQIKFDSLLPPTGFSFALRADDRKMLGLLNQALTGLDGSVHREILGRWTLGLGADLASQRLNLSAIEQRWARRHQQVTVAATQHPPYIYKDSHGRWVGLNVDVLARISRMTGLTFDFAEMPTTRHALEALGNGSADMNTTLAETPRRKQMLDFSYAFGGTDWVFVVRADSSTDITLERLSGKVLAMPVRHALLDYIQAEYPSIVLSLVPTYDDARRLVEKRQAEATIQNDAGAWLYPPGQLKVGRSVEGKWSPDRFSVVKHEPELLSILNKALEEFPVAEMRAIRMKWLGAVISQPSIWQRIPAWIYWAVAVASLLGIVSLAWSSRLKYQIHQRKRAEEQLNDQLAFKRALLDGIPNPIYVRDLQGRLISCNQSYETSFGVSFEQMNGRRLIDVNLIPADVAQQMHVDYMTLLKTHEPVFADRSMVLAGRQIEAWQWTVPFFRADGQLQGLLGGWIDISERKRLERELTAAQHKAEQANQAKSAFLATMSHDIRTPMGAIIGLLELELERTRLRGQQPCEGLQVAHRAATELVELIGQSLDLAKIESGKLQLAEAVTSLRALFEDACQLFQARAQQIGLRFTLAISSDAEGDYWIDPLRLRQVLHNVIGNALKFTQAGSVHIDVTCGGLTGQRRLLRIQVSDTGAGIAPEQQARLFQPFAQGDGHHPGPLAGSGLGLSICKRLVDLMQGHIGIASEVGQGTRVTIELPLLRAEPQVAQPAPALPVTADVVSAHACWRLLVADDLSANRLVLTGQLELLGHEVTAVGSGDAALQRWREGDFDAVITDCNMPGMSGHELTQIIRTEEQREGRQAIAVLGITANALQDEHAHCLAVGMDALLVKPVSLAQLREKLQALLAQASEDRQFDIQVLHHMTQANEQQIQRMLMELEKNLAQELALLQPAVADRDWKTLGESVHRLKGVACLIDAVPLAKACAELDRHARNQSDSELDAAWRTLESSIDALRHELHAHLADASAL